MAVTALPEVAGTTREYGVIVREVPRCRLVLVTPPEASQVRLAISRNLRPKAVDLLTTGPQWFNC